MAALQLISLDTTTPRLRAPASGDTYSAPRAMDIAPESLTGSAATSSLSIAQTWNTTGTPTAIDLNVTNTASAAASKLMRLNVGGVTRFSVEVGGKIFFGPDAGPSTIQSSGTIMGLGSSGNIVVGVDSGAQQGFRLATSAYFGWNSVGGALTGGAPDVTLYRDAANTLAQRNGTAAQAFNIYNTYTDASNYERGVMKWSSNVLQIGTDKLGTGTARALEFQTDGMTRLTVNAVGQTIVSGDFGATGTLQITAGGARQMFHNGSSLALRSTSSIILMGTDGNGANPDLDIRRVAAGVLRLSQNGANVGGALEMIEQTAPAAPSANFVRIYAEDNGAGKTRLMALFATGVAQQLAVEP